jgi:hypothetical protein
MAGPYNETGKLSAKDVLDALAPMTWLRSVSTLIPGLHAGVARGKPCVTGPSAARGCAQIDVHPTRTFGGDIKAALRRLTALKELSFGGAYARCVAAFTLWTSRSTTRWRTPTIDSP